MATGEESVVVIGVITRLKLFVDSLVILMWREALAVVGILEQALVHRLWHMQLAKETKRPCFTVLTWALRKDCGVE